jgi:uncharacterized protein (DUF1499 family)
MTPAVTKVQGLAGRLAAATAVFAAIALGLGAVLLVAAGPAYRSGLLTLGTAFDTLRSGVVVALVAGGLALAALGAALACRHRGQAVTAALVVVVSVALVTVPLLHWQRAKTVPPIHDITTDPDDPPAFVALAQARARAPNAVAYPGAETARQQRAAYPEIRPLLLAAPLPRVREVAREVVRASGWELVAATDTTLEATDTTPWFGFKDDVVIRLRPTADGVRVDLRSASRIGRSDVGTNAARIRVYLEALAGRVEED